MNERATVARIESELDSIQCFVTLTWTKEGIVVKAANDIDRLIANAAVRKAGMEVVLSLCR